MSRPPRIKGFSYVGFHRYFLTFCTFDRRKAFQDAVAVAAALTHFRSTAKQHAFEIAAYCFMPDHAHLLIEATSDVADLRRFAKMAKQRSGAAYALEHGRGLWQEGYYERALRDAESVRSIAKYILENPVRAGLVGQVVDYPFCGSDLWTMKELLTVYE